MNIYLLNSDYSVIGIVGEPRRVTVVRRYFEPGEISVILPVSFGDIPIGASYIYEPQSGECAHIDGVTRSEDGLGLSGRSLEALLSQRVIYGEVTYSGLIETSARSAVSANAISARAIPHLLLGTVSGIEDTGELSASWSNLSDWLYASLKPHGASYRVKLDTEGSAIRFTVVRGVDRTRTQSARAPAVFCTSDGAGARFAYSDDSSANVAYVSGFDGTVVSVPSPSPTGLLRRETFVSAGDIRPVSYDTTEAYLAALRHRGLERLAGREAVTGLRGGVPVCGGGTAGSDFDLGDLCEIEAPSGTYTARVTQITETFADGVHTVTPYIGGDAESEERNLRRRLTEYVSRTF